MDAATDATIGAVVGATSSATVGALVSVTADAAVDATVGATVSAAGTYVMPRLLPLASISTKTVYPYSRVISSTKLRRQYSTFPSCFFPLQRASSRFVTLCHAKYAFFDLASFHRHIIYTPATGITRLNMPITSSAHRLGILCRPYCRIFIISALENMPFSSVCPFTGIFFSSQVLGLPKIYASGRSRLFHRHISTSRIYDRKNTHPYLR